MGPSIKLLGAPAFQPTGGAPPLLFTPERPYQLLAFLASNARWVHRDELGTLLWPDRSSAHARSNLRKVLLLARQLPHISEIEQQGDALRWSPESDVSRFETAWAGGDFEAAASIGAEPFLHGMENGLLDASREWIIVERGRLEERWRAACLRCLQLVGTDSPTAVAVSTALLKRDPLDETATLTLARSHDVRGHKGPALAVLNEYADRLRRELSVEPSPEWQRAVQSIHGEMVIARPAPVPAAKPSGSFVGRRTELGQIAELLEKAECRVLTLTGFAGMGKSALARAALTHALDERPNSAVWITLADLTTPTEVALRLATSLGLTLAGQREPWPQIHEALAERALLVVLDNAEHLPLIEALEDWLAACPAIQILATSRTRLGIVGEWLLPVDGLPLPDEDEDDVEVLRHCDAIRLFEARVRPFVPGFDLSAQRAAVCRLVRLLGGSPLGIALAAARTRVMSVADIASSLAESIEMLDGVAPEERGIRSGFEQAWDLLTAPEQDAAAKLAWMPGEFGRAIAAEVAKVSLPVLASLVDKAFLRTEGPGRFSMHALIRQWAAPRVGDSEALLIAHSAYVGQWLGRHADPMSDLPSAAFMSEIDREIAHVRLAARRAVARCDDELLASVSRALSTYFDRRGMWSEGLALFEGAVVALERAADDRDPALPGPGHAAALRALGVLRFRSGQIVAAETSARKLLQMASSLADVHLEKSALQMIGLSAWQQGRFEDAREAMASAVRLAEQVGDARGRSNFLGNLAMIESALGRFDDALRNYSEVLAFNRGSGSPETIVSALANLGVLYQSLGQHDEALTRFNEALLYCNKDGMRSTRPYVFLNLGLVHEELDHVEAAAGFLVRAIEDARSHGSPMVESGALLAQARLDLGAGRTQQAYEKTAQAMLIGERTSDAAIQLLCVFSHGEIIATEGNVPRGVALMRWALAQPMIDASIRSRAVRRLASWHSPDASDIDARMALAEVLAMLPSRPG